MKELILEVWHISKRFGKVRALEDVSFKVFKGEVYALVGPNGAGKTTTLRIICSLLRPDEGFVKVKGYDVLRQRKEAMQYITFVPDAPIFYPSLTVREHIELFCYLRGVDVDEVQDRVEYLLSSFNLKKYENMLISKLSRGNIQKLALTLALLLKPPLIVMDEPYNNIDIDAQRFLQDEIIRLREEGCSFVVSSHILPWVSRIATRVGFIFRGRIVEEGTLPELLEKYEVNDLEELYVKVIKQAEAKLRRA